MTLTLLTVNVHWSQFCNDGFYINTLEIDVYIKCQICSFMLSMDFILELLPHRNANFNKFYRTKLSIEYTTTIRRLYAI
jgi:hypothetical protein